MVNALTGHKARAKSFTKQMHLRMTRPQLQQKRTPNEVRELVQWARQALEEEKHCHQFKPTTLPTKINK
jgi:hypothetical protein